ncbi:glycoside hydrolase family 1 protein [Cryptosporangium minutisporangium]|uniref:glycoside hydrolase family 1 protein n=1 Tax=Cryptosporangium minutisporangium TaxID=113569 RepID=UPI0031EA86E0
MPVPVSPSFLWGAATSPHQVEGNNTASDLWALENAPGSPLPDRSGDACDSYHRWREDLDLVCDLGLNAYRFGIEWARVEPVPGHLSRAALAHYRRMIEGCLERGLTPVVTLHHFTSPAWFRHGGGWTGPDGIQRFTDYVRAVRPILDGVPWVCTINEPNMLAMVAARLRHDAPDLVAGALPPPDQGLADALVAAHHAARAELADLDGTASGWTVANQTFQALPGAEAVTEEWAWSRENQFLDAARADDFIGVQAYTRVVIGPDGPVPTDPAARRTQTGWEFYPEALEYAVRHTAGRIPVPILVTENGIATADDGERREYTQRALAGLGRAVADGVDVRGYLHWSLLDNYEWGSWAHTFGLVAVDRQTFRRTVKPSAHWYSDVARSSRLPDDR